MSGATGMDYTAHETAIVDAGARIGAGTRIWHWVHVCGGARIGARCSIGQNCFVGNRVRIGDNCKIQNHVSVYDDVTLEDDVFCGPSMVFTNVCNPRSAVPRKTEYQPTHVKRGVSIGANATIVCGITLHEHAFIAAAALVNRDVPAFALVGGVPARQLGWMSRYGERIPLPVEGEGEHRCPHTGDRYRLSNATMELVEAGQLAGET